jgi:hypothetical protein
MSALPGVLAEIADVAGEAAALAVAEAAGGTSVYFPPRPRADHWLCTLIGPDAALRVCDRLTAGVGPRRVDLPLGPTGHVADMRKAQATIDRMIMAGRSERDIARATGYTIRQVRRRRARLRDDRQLSLL